MLQNPFLNIPQVESAASRSWAAGFLYGFQGPEQSSLAQDQVETEDSDAFNQGVLDGQNAAINGLELDEPCVDLNAEPPSVAHFAADAASEAAFTIFGIATLGLHVAGVAAEAIIAVVNLSIALETFSDDPDAVITQRAQRLQAALADVGVTNAMELFVGGGVDTSATGCELKLTPIFRHQDSAVAAARAIGRDQWLVIGWRSNQSGGIQVADSSAQ